MMSACSNSVEQVSELKTLTITSQPTAQTIDDGTTASFSVAASGEGALSYQWRKNSQDIEGATGSSYVTPPMTLADNESTFDVVVSGGVKQITSSSAMLTVQAVAPMIVTQPVSQVALNNGTVTFSVSVTGSQPMQYQWYRNGLEITGATNDSYSIANVSTSDDASSFTVLVKNTAGEVDSNVATINLTQFSINVNVTGLSTGTILQVVNANSNPITYTENGNQNFTIPAVDGSLYDILISQQPQLPAHNCVISNGSASGQITSENVSVSIFCVGEITAFYATNGLNWNDYIINDGNSSITSTGSACAGNGNGYSSCINGGEIRFVSVPGIDSCIGITANDNLNAFNWVCDASNINDIKLVSTSLNQETSLSDLVDFDFIQWKPNNLKVYKDQVLYVETPLSQWWSNPIIEMPADGNLNTIGNIYLITSDPGVAITFSADKTALLVKPKITASTAVSIDNLITATDRKYIWIEGAYNATTTTDGIDFLRVTNSTIRNTRVFYKDYVASTGNFRLIYFTFSDSNYLKDVFVTNSSVNGIDLYSSNFNNFSHIVSANNGNFGVYLQLSRNNVFTQLTAANNISGVHLTSQSYNNVFINTTSINNGGGFGLWEPGSGSNVIHNLTAFNNASSGLHVTSSENSIINFASTHNGHFDSLNGQNVGWGVFIDSVSGRSSYFSGILKFGNNLVGDCGGGITTTNGGIVKDSCEPNALSDFGVPITGVNMQNTFVGKIAGNDPNNTTDTGGEVFSIEIYDWLSFANQYRFWGKSGSNTIYPSSDQQGQCGKSENCHIWDVSLRNTDAVLKGILSTPTGDNTAVHTWQDATKIRYLRNAAEISGDGIGNNNGLCESGESCLFTPNIGSYQGHGNLLPVNFIDGQLVNIKLFAYEFNGV